MAPLKARTRLLLVDSLRQWKTATGRPRPCL